MTHYVERAGRRAGRPRLPSQTLPEYGRSLDALMGSGDRGWAALAREVEASAYGGHDPEPTARRDMLAAARRTRVPRTRRGSAKQRDHGRRELTTAAGPR